MTTRLNALADRIAGQGFGLTNYLNLEADMNYLIVGGAPIASLSGSNGLAITARYHRVTVATGNVDNITDALGLSVGQWVDLSFANAQTIRNNGGGSGNIRIVGGADRVTQPNEVITFVYDGTNWWAAGSSFSGGYSSNFNVVSSTSLTTIFNQAIPGGLLGTNSALRIGIEGDYLNNSGGTRNFLFQILYGATTLWGHTIPNTPVSPQHRAFYLDGLLSNEGATNAQRFAGHISIGENSLASVAGIGQGNNNSDLVEGTIGGSSAEDSTAAKTLLIQVQHDASNASLAFKGTVHVSYQP